MSLINVCREIDCPYFCSDSGGYGCRKYSVALYCHLIYREQGVRTAGFEQTTQYTVMAESVDGLKELNETYLKSDEQYIRDTEIFDLIGSDKSKHYPNRVLTTKYKRVKFSEVEIGDAFFLVLPDGKHPSFKLSANRAGYPSGRTTTLLEVKVSEDQMVEVSVKQT